VINGRIFFRKGNNFVEEIMAMKTSGHSTKTGNMKKFNEEPTGEKSHETTITLHCGKQLSTGYSNGIVGSST
jgi:hypothetical protein